MAVAGAVVICEKAVIAAGKYFQKIAVIAQARLRPVGISAQRLARHGKFITANAHAKRPVAVAAHAVGHRARPRVAALNGFLGEVGIASDAPPQREAIDGQCIILTAGVIAAAWAANDLHHWRPIPVGLRLAHGGEIIVAAHPRRLIGRNFGFHAVKIRLRVETARMNKRLGKSRVNGEENCCYKKNTYWIEHKSMDKHITSWVPMPSHRMTLICSFPLLSHFLRRRPTRHR